MSDTLHVYTDGLDWLVAHSPEDALALWCELSDYTPEKRAAEGFSAPFRQEPDEEPFTIVKDCGVCETTKTCAQWAAEGRRHLATTEH